MKIFYSVLILVCLLGTAGMSHAQTSWKGTTSTSWSNAGNWTAGVPTASVDAIIGDANFTGSFQPAISSSSYCKTLTLGGTVASTLSLSKNLTVSGNVTINSNGTISLGGATITLSGNWSNAGSFTTSSTSSTVTFNGVSQSIGGSVTTTFRKLKINTGSTVTLNSNVTVSGSGNLLTVSGTLYPNESPTYQVTAGSMSVKANAVLKVIAATFAGNYSVTTTTLSAGSIVDYAATAVNQTVSNTYTYSTLKISGSGTKTLAGNLPSLTSSLSSYGNIYVTGGTFDLSTFTANRGTSTTGGTFSVSNGATLKIGGTNTFPANFNTKTLSLTSTVEYSGTAQTVAALTYGNLTLSSASGAATKTMPAAAFTIEGAFTTSQGTGTSVSCTAGNNITVNGNISIGTATTFNGSSFTHTIAGNWTNNGTYTGATGTVIFSGAGTHISGSGTQNFNNISITASGINAAAATSLAVAGDLSTSGAGAFTHLAGGAVTMSGTGKTISGTNITLSSLTVSGSVTNTSSLTLTGDLAVSGSFTASGGAVTMSGTGKTISGAGSISFDILSIPGSVTASTGFSISTSLNVTGSFTASAGTATFTGTSTLSGTANLYNVTLNGTSLQLTTNAVLGIANTYTVTAGTLNVTSTTPNSVDFNGTAAQTINSGTYHHLLCSNSGAKTAGGALTVNGDFTIGATATFNSSSFTHTIAGNWNRSGTFNAGTGGISFTGNNAATLSGATTFNTLTVNKTSSLTLQNDVNAATVAMTAGSMQTGSNTLTITGTRSGTGIILGNIKRSHTFTTGTAYAFESPDNTISFSSVSGVTSITVSVSQSAVSDFPFGGSINRQYSISVPAGTYNATLRLHYEDADLNGNAESTITLWNYSGSAWANAGKLANSTSANYVEQSGLTNIATRWTLSDDANVVRWNGSVSNDWGTAANWTAVQGSPSTPPSATDIVQIGTAAFTNQPTISGSVTVKNIIFGSTQAATLTLGSGGSLTTTGNISGNWSAGVTHTINAGAQTLNINGDLQLSDGTSGHAINLQASGGTITIGGALTESGGANITLTGTSTINVAGDFNYTSGTFSPGTGSVTYNGTGMQSVAAVPYYNLSVNKSSGTATANTAASVSGNLTILAGQLYLGAAMTVSGNVTINSGTTLNVTNTTLNIGGNLVNNGSFQSTGSDVNLTGTGNQDIAAGTFNNITINKPSGTAMLTGNVLVNNNLSILSGTLDMGSFTANRTATGGTFTVANGSSLLLSGASNFPSGYGTYTLGTTSNVTFNGSGAQSVPGITYGNLSFTNGGATAKTLAASATVNGDLTINSSATFNAASYTLGLGGNWVNSGSFTPGTGTLLLNGTSKTLSGNTTFNKVTVYGSYTTLGSDMTFNGLLNITPSGSYTAGSGVATVNGDLTNQGSLTSVGTTTFTGNTVQTIRFLNAVVSNSSGIINFNGTVSPVLNSTSSPTYANLVINNTAGVNASVGWIVLVSFTITSGAVFNGGVSTHNIAGAFTNQGTVTSSGTMNFNPSTAVNVNFGSTGFSSTGAVVLGGSGQITLSGTPATLTNVTIANTNAAGITPPSGWTIGGDFTITSNAIFNAGSYNYTVAGDIESNGTLNGGSSTFTMTSTAGSISGNNSTIFRNFTIPSSAVITANADFGVSGNFTDNGTYDGSAGALIMAGSTASVIDGTAAPVTIAQIINDKTGGAVTTLAKNISGVTNLDIMSGVLDDAGFTISQNAGALAIEDAGTLRIGGTNTMPVFNSYTLDTLSTVEYAGTTQSIAAMAAGYGNLSITAAGTKTAAAALTILNNFTLSAGTFAGGSFTHLLAGNWNMSGGTFTNTGTTIQLNGIANQDLFSTGAFNNLTLNKTAGLATLSGNITVNGTLNFTAGKLSIGNNNLTMGNSSSFTGATAAKYVVATGTGTVTQQVATSGSKTYPVGTTTSYVPATIAFSGTSTTDNISVRVMPAVYRNGTTGNQVNSDAVNATWMISEGTPGGSDATVTLQWPGSLELSGFNRTACRLAHYVGYWDYGTVDIAAAGADPYTATRSGITSFSPFAVGGNQALPVSWIDMYGKRNGANNEIYWSTADEKDNDHFDVEVSENGSDFKTAGRVAADKHTAIVHEYRFVHENIFLPAAWYRIRQMDIDGTFSYSKTIRINAGNAYYSNLSVSAQSADHLQAAITAPAAGNAGIVINDLSGRMLYRRDVYLEKGSNKITIDFPAAAGIYTLWLTDDKGNRSFVKFTK